MAEPILDYGSVSVADWNDAQIKEEQVQFFLLIGIIFNSYRVRTFWDAQPR